MHEADSTIDSALNLAQQLHETNVKGNDAYGTSGKLCLA